MTKQHPCIQTCQSISECGKREQVEYKIQMVQQHRNE